MTGNHFRIIEPKILYFGTPVALVSSLNVGKGREARPAYRKESCACQQS